MSVHLITGYAGKEHITSSDQASFNASVFGEGAYVFNKGSILKATVLSNTAVSIADGDLLLNGRHIRITETETVNFDIGMADLCRIDLIAIAYEQDTDTGIESARLKVIKGIPSTSPIVPDATPGDFVLYKVNFKNFTLESIERQFEVILSNLDLFRNLQFALSQHEMVLNRNSWDVGTGAYSGYYVQSRHLKIDAYNFLETKAPFFMLDESETKTGYNTEYVDAETYFSMLEMNVEKTDTGFKYIFYSLVKPKVDLYIIVKGV